MCSDINSWHVQRYQQLACAAISTAGMCSDINSWHVQWYQQLACAAISTAGMCSDINSWHVQQVLCGLATAQTYDWPEPYHYRHIRCTYGICSREITIRTVIYGADIRFWPTLHKRQQISRLYLSCILCMPLWPRRHVQRVCAMACAAMAHQLIHRNQLWSLCDLVWPRRHVQRVCAMACAAMAHQLIHHN
jgi:hypothetical protein